MATKLFKRKLERRERLLLIIACAVGAFILYTLLKDPWAKYQQSHAQLKQARTRLELVYEFKKQVDLAQTQKEHLLTTLAANGNEDLWGYLNRIVREQGIGGDRAEVTTKPSATRSSDNMSAVQVQLRGISTEELVNVLYGIHDGQLVALQQLDYLKPSLGGKGLDCNMTFIAPRT